MVSGDVPVRASERKQSFGRMLTPCSAEVATRWYVAAVYTFLVSNQCLFWFTFSTASEPGVKEYYGCDDGFLDLLLAWGPIVGVIVQPWATALLSRPNGLRRSMWLAAILSLTCCALRLLPSFFRPTVRKQALSRAILCVAQALNAAAGPLLMGSCSMLSALWFPPESRGRVV